MGEAQMEKAHDEQGTSKILIVLPVSRWGNVLNAVTNQLPHFQKRGNMKRVLLPTAIIFATLICFAQRTPAQRGVNVFTSDMTARRARRSRAAGAAGLLRLHHAKARRSNRSSAHHPLRVPSSMRPIRRSSPSRIVSGCGGQPGTKRSTGTTAAAPPRTSPWPM